MLQTISINQKFNLQFISPLRDYEADLILLRRLGFKPEYADVTKENSLCYAEGRPEVMFTVEVNDVIQAAWLKQALHNANR